MVPLRTDADLPLDRIGGKAASLVRLARAGFPVPDGWFLTSEFFESWTARLGQSDEWREVCRLAADSMRREGRAGLTAACDAVKARARELVLDARQQRVLESLDAAVGEDVFAVRSSSPEEDLAEASFAGLYDTVLGVTGDRLEDAIRRCFVSCLDARVVIYKQERNLPVDVPRIAVVVQQQVASDVSASRSRSTR